MSTNIWWIRRDLRLHDNQALMTAVNNADKIIPVFILDPNLLQSKYTNKKRLHFMADGLIKLDRQLKSLGSKLVLRLGDPVAVLNQLTKQYHINVIYAEADHSPYANLRDSKVIASLPLKLIGSPAALPPGTVTKPNHSPYTVFTPFSKAWKLLWFSEPRNTFPPPKAIISPMGFEEINLSILDEYLDSNLNFPAGQEEAIQRLYSFVSRISGKIYAYNENRDTLDNSGTSSLSPYLRFGMISARQAVLAAINAIHEAPDKQSKSSAETWLNELIWRDFYIHILHHFPYVRHQNFRSIMISWQNDLEEYDRWCAGQTGFPIIDAGMRQLRQLGWMHNRARMITASFLTKDLLIDWRWGETWFMQNLIDGDPAANNGGWQWSAGTGTDAAPYFRIFNPVTQGYKYDPTGGYIRRWVPELKDVPTGLIHEPWKMSVDQQLIYGVKLGINYPHPIIDHQFARQRALAAYRQKDNFN